jgi:hypothetical protein
VASWTIDLHSLNGAAVLTDFPFNDATFGWVLDGPGGFEATLPGNHSAVTRANFALGQRELRVKRDGTLVWGGYLWGASVDLRTPRYPEVRIRGEGYASRLRRRFVLTDLIYSDVAQQTIARNLIDHAESQPSGDLGIDTTLLGNHSGGTVLRDRAYCLADHVNVGDAIDELAALDDGIDWEIGPAPDLATNKLLKTYQPRKGTDRTGTLTIAATGPNAAVGINYDESGDTVASRMLTIGGGGDCNPAEDDRSDAGALASYGLLMGIDSIESDRLVDVVAHNREQLRLRKVPLWTPEVVVPEDRLAWAGLVVGDSFTLASAVGPAGGFGQFSQAMRCLAFDVTVQPGAGGPDEGIVFYSVTVDSAVGA